MAAVLFGFEDLLYSWDSLVWSLTSRALRTCRFGNLRVLQLMLKPWCISRAVYQADLLTPQTMSFMSMMSGYFILTIFQILQFYFPQGEITSQNNPWFVWVSLPIHKPEHLEMKSAIADHHLAQQGSIEHVLF
ncbi:hypothetical protein Q9966_014740 [Columba livia]|nr:hypothetical protein Q9966_014740 [Columba livia]